MSDNCELPDFSSDAAAVIAQRLFGLDGSIKALDGERDLNFLIADREGKFVFKIANLMESPAMLECQHLVLKRLASARLFERVVLPRPSLDGNDLEFVRDPRGRQHACRVLPFIEGRMLADLDQFPAGLLQDLGRRLALMDLALAGFSHPALERPLLWKMERATEIVDSYRALLADDEQRHLVDTFVNVYRDRLAARETGLRRGVIHNDANRGNVVVDPDSARVVSIIDFGDMIESWLAVEPAIAATYAMLGQTDPIARALEVIHGYQAELALNQSEAEMLFDFICMRLCMSVCICAHQQRLAPDNAYLSIDVEPSWELLAALQALNHDDIRDRFLAACGHRPA